MIGITPIFWNAMERKVNSATLGRQTTNGEEGELGDVGQADDDAVERPEAEIEQVERDPCRAFVDVAIGEPPVAVDDRGAVGVFREPVREMRCDRAVLPVALLPVLLRELGREPDDAFEHGLPPPAAQVTDE